MALILLCFSKSAAEIFYKIAEIYLRSTLQRHTSTRWLIPVQYCPLFPGQVGHMEVYAVFRELEITALNYQAVRISGFHSNMFVVRQNFVTTGNQPFSVNFETG